MSDIAQSVASLAQLFHVGKLVRCKIVSNTTKRSKKIVTLTINPKDVNKDVKLLKSGMVSLNRIVMYSFCFVITSDNHVGNGTVAFLAEMLLAEA